MPLASDLMGTGLAQEQASRLGFSTLTTFAGVGIAQVGAKAIPKFTNNVLATTVAGQTAFVLPSTAELNMPYLVTNSGPSVAAEVFPPTGGTINESAVNLAKSITLNHARMFIRLSSTRWISFLTV